jgi:hypothetical protein
MLGENKFNVYGFGDWIGAPLPAIQKKETREKSEQEKTK